MSRTQLTDAVDPWSRSLLLGAVIVLALAGCNQPEEVTVTTVPTRVPDQLLPGKDRMLAAMVPQGDKVWFFKVTGPEKAISRIANTGIDEPRLV